MYRENDNQKLLEEWSRMRPEYETFTFDGVLNESIYTNSNPRIALLLKESNDDFVEIAPLNGDGYGPNGSSPLFWRNINIFIYIATCAWNGRIVSIKDIKDVTEKKVNSIAYINVKKKAENKPTSSNKEILKYAREDKDFLRRQINLIDPEVVFLANTKSCFDEIQESIHIAHNVYKGSNNIVIDYYHPSTTIGFDNCIKHLSTALFDAKVQEQICRLKEKRYMNE